jgi:CBS domain-containing protein
VGLLTVTDFIDVLRYYRRTKGNVSTLATRSIADILSDSNILGSVLVRHVPKCGQRDAAAAQAASHHGVFISASVNATLKQACLLLHRHSLDFLPVILEDDMRCLATITYTNILEHLVTHFREQRRLFDDTVFHLGIGTYHEDVVTARATESLAEVLHILHVNGLSAIPVVDDNSKIVGVYSRSDITFLAAATDAEDAVSNLDLTLDVLMSQRRTDVTTPDALHTCTKAHTLQSIFEYFAQWKFNRLIVVDEHERVVGVVSARDLVAYFLEDI